MNRAGFLKLFGGAVAALAVPLKLSAERDGVTQIKTLTTVDSPMPLWGTNGLYLDGGSDTHIHEGVSNHWKMWVDHGGNVFSSPCTKSAVPVRIGGPTIKHGG